MYGKKNFDIITRNRFLILLVGILIVFIVIIIKTTTIMVVEEDSYKELLKKMTNNEVYGTSSPRGRIYDRNYNIIVDNKSLKTITYQKPKNTTNKEMIEVALRISPHIDVNYNNNVDSNNLIQNQ